MNTNDIANIRTLAAAANGCREAFNEGDIASVEVLDDKDTCATVKATIEMVPAMEGDDFGDCTEFGVFVSLPEQVLRGEPDMELVYMSDREDQAKEAARLINEGYDIEGAISKADLM